MLRIRDIEQRPIHRLPYLNAAKRGGSETKVLEVVRAPTEGLACEAVLVTSDLQGMAPSWYEGGASVLLGEALAEQLEVISIDGAIPPLDQIGVILAGDLYSVPEANKRGGFGNVTSVWQSFAAGFRWVVGVAGNHDGFGREKDKFALTSQDNVHLLDCELAEVDSMSFGGVGYIIGDPAKKGRRDEDDQIARIELVLAEKPDVLVLHQGPNGDEGQRGSDRIREIIDASPPPLVICGHCHWQEPLAELGSGGQILNVDARAILLVRA